MQVKGITLDKNTVHCSYQRTTKIAAMEYILQIPITQQHLVQQKPWHVRILKDAS